MKAAIFLAEGFEEVEGLTAVDLLRRAGIEVFMVSITGGKAVTGSHGITVQADEQIEDFDFSKVSMLILPGGMPGTKNLEKCQKLTEQLKIFAHEEKYVAAICAAPSVLGHLGILEGKEACCYPGFEKELYGAKVCVEGAVADGNVITGRGVGTAIPFALKMIEKCIGEEKAKQIADSIVY